MPTHSFSIYFRSILVLYTIYVQAFQLDFFFYRFPHQNSLSISLFLLRAPNSSRFIPFYLITSMAIHGAPMYSCFYSPFHSSLKIRSICGNKNFANKNCLRFSNTLKAPSQSTMIHVSTAGFQNAWSSTTTASWPGASCLC